MKLIISFFLLSFLEYSFSADLPCDLVRKDPTYSVGYIKIPVGFCSGVLLSPHLVLTAAHCTLNQNTEDIEFSLKGAVHPTYAKAQKVIIHPSFWNARDGSNGGIDLSIIKLDSTSYGDVPHYFFPYGLTSSIELGDTAVSWGFGLQEGGEIAKRRKKPITFSIFQNALSKDGQGIKNARLSFKRGETGEIQCSGDSGGPVFYEAKDGLRIIGINSKLGVKIKYTSKQGLIRKLSSKEYFCQHGDQFLAVNLSAAKDWIDENVERLEKDKSKARCAK